MDVLEREAKCVQLRRAKLPWAQVAQEAGYRSPEAAAVAYRRAINRVPTAQVDELRLEEGDMLDRLHTAVWRDAMNGDPVAVAAVLKISEQRSKLFGLYAPTKSQVEVTDNTKQRIIELVDQIRELPPATDEIANRREMKALPSGTSKYNATNVIPG